MDRRTDEEKDRWTDKIALIVYQPVTSC
jgi:hypothetical protein